MVEIKYSEQEKILNKLWAKKDYEAYEKFKAILLSNRHCIEHRDIAWMRSHLIINKQQVVIEEDRFGNPIRWRSHSYLTDEELAYLTDQLKDFY